MKLLKYLIILLINASILTSCSSDDANDSNSNSDGFYMQASIVGYGDDLYRVEGEMLCTYTLVSGIMNITSAYQDGSRVLTISLTNFNGPGEYPCYTSFDSFAVCQFVENDISYSSMHSSPYGSVIVTSYDPENGTIEGSFTFKGTNQQTGDVRTVAGNYKCRSYVQLLNKKK